MGVLHLHSYQLFTVLWLTLFYYLAQILPDISVVLLSGSTEFLTLCDMPAFILAVHFPSSIFHQKLFLTCNNTLSFLEPQQNVSFCTSNIFTKYVELCDHLTEYTLHSYVVSSLLQLLFVSFHQLLTEESSRNFNCHSVLAQEPVNSSTPIMYEGWNFNSGNYLFTTDTK